jgi:ABC-type Fe3+-hydroxamate transport system substrate-binding protein
MKKEITPTRIVSLVPSLTEALFAFGVGDKVVGRTRYCTQPPHAVGRIAKVGGTKKVDLERVLSLRPDLVVAVKEENVREDVKAIEEAGVPVLLGTPETVEQAIGLLKELANRVQAPGKRAATVIDATEKVYEKLKAEQTEPLTKKPRVFVPIWKKPYMSVGGDTYIHDVLMTCGGENVCEDHARYPTVSLQEVENSDPEVVLMPDEPYPFSAEDLPEFYEMDTVAARKERIHLIDGKLLSWYGPRMASSLTQLAALLRYPEQR